MYQLIYLIVLPYSRLPAECAAPISRRLAVPAPALQASPQPPAVTPSLRRNGGDATPHPGQRTAASHTPNRRIVQAHGCRRTHVGRQISRLRWARSGSQLAGSQLNATIKSGIRAFSVSIRLDPRCAPVPTNVESRMPKCDETEGRRGQSGRRERGSKAQSGGIGKRGHAAHGKGSQRARWAVLFGSDNAKKGLRGNTDAISPWRKSRRTAVGRQPLWWRTTRHPDAHLRPHACASRRIVAGRRKSTATTSGVPPRSLPAGVGASRRLYGKTKSAQKWAWRANSRHCPKSKIRNRMYQLIHPALPTYKTAPPPHHGKAAHINA